MTARTRLLMLCGSLMRQNPKSIFINGIFCDRFNALGYRPAALISACDRVILVKTQGWDYSPIVQDEIVYAGSLGKPIDSLEVA